MSALIAPVLYFGALFVQPWLASWVPEPLIYSFEAISFQFPVMYCLSLHRFF